MFRKPFLLAAIVPLLAAPIFAEQVNSPSHHFSYDLPGGWRSLNSAEIADLKARAASTGFTGEFLGGGHPIASTLPVFVIQPGPGFTGDAERAVGGFREGFARASGATVSAAAYDPKLNAFTLEAVIKTPSGNVHETLYAFLGKEEILSFHCDAMESDAPSAHAVFEKLAASFHFDPGYAFTPPTGIDSLFKSANGSAAIGVIVGAIAGPIAVLYLRHRKGKNTTATSSQ